MRRYDFFDARRALALAALAFAFFLADGNCLGAIANRPRTASVNDSGIRTAFPFGLSVIGRSYAAVAKLGNAPALDAGGMDSIWSLVGATPSGRTYYSRMADDEFHAFNIACKNCGCAFKTNIHFQLDQQLRGQMWSCEFCGHIIEVPSGTVAEIIQNQPEIRPARDLAFTNANPYGNDLHRSLDKLFGSLQTQGLRAPVAAFISNIYRLESMLELPVQLVWLIDNLKIINGVPNLRVEVNDNSSDRATLLAQAMLSRSAAEFHILAIAQDFRTPAGAK